MQQASLLLRVLLLTPLTSAHFVVNVPLPLSNDINGEDTAPCGGSTPSPSDAVTDFHVGGDAIGLTTLHAHSSFAYRGALGTSLASPNWTVLIPTLAEYGLNGFCEPAVPAPASWAGSKGLLQVIQDAEDGVHFQCMVVNFVPGVGTPPSTCSNSSGVSADYASDPKLSSAEGASPSASSTASVTSSTQAASASAASAQASPSSAASRRRGSGGLTGDAFMGVLFTVLLFL